MADHRTSQTVVHGLIWATLLAVSAPILLELSRHVVGNSWTWYALAFPPLTFVAFAWSPLQNARIKTAVLFVMAGIAIEFWAMASGALRHGRIGFALAVMGVLFLQGRDRPRAAVLLALCIPIPSFVLERLGRPLLFILAELLAALFRALGTPALAVGRQIDLPIGTLRMIPMDSGWTTGLLAFGLAWFACLQFRIDIMRSVFVAVLAGFAGAVVHVIVTVVLMYASDRTMTPEGLVEVRMCRDLVTIATTLIGAGFFSIAWHRKTRVPV